jgi:hypothetical protein
MKITKEGNKVILEFEPADAGGLDLEYVIDSYYEGMKLMIENPALRDKLIASLQANAPQEFRSAESNLLDRWEIPHGSMET